MPLYCFHCLDDETHGAERRSANRPAHLEWAGTLGERIRMAGPLMSEDGRMMGSLFLIEAESLDAAKELGQQDPYAKAGLFADVQINEVKWLLGPGKPA